MNKLDWKATLLMYGVTQVAILDGNCQFVTAVKSMSVKKT